MIIIMVTKEFRHKKGLRNITFISDKDMSNYDIIKY